MSLRHTKEITDFNIPSCPPSNCIDKEIENVFRFSEVHNISAKTFKTPYELNKKRMPPMQKIVDKMPFPCNLLALSFYTTEEHARNAHANLKKEHPKLKLNFLIIGTIKYGDGKSEPENDFGHFNHHPYKTTEYKGFNLVGKL